MTFQEQLSAAAEKYKTYHNQLFVYDYAFRDAAHWTLNSELIKELEAALPCRRVLPCNDRHIEGCDNCTITRKLKEARES